MAARALVATLPLTPTPVIADRIDLDAEEQVTVTVNGQAFAARIGPGRSSTVHLRSADAAALFGPAATRFDQRGDWTGATRTAERVGPVTVRGHRAPALIAFPFGTHIAPVEWFEREDTGADAGQLGAFAVPATIVHFRLRPVQPGERSVALPLDPEDNRWGIASTSLDLGEARVRFAVAPHLPVTVASAAAGGAMARAQGGRFTGPPQSVLISHGVSRPARPVLLDRPLAIGSLLVRTLLVRTLDYGAATGIADQRDEPENPADILVTARTDRQAPNYIVYLAADVLGGCSSVTFDKAAMTITLSCLP